MGQHLVDICTGDHHRRAVAIRKGVRQRALELFPTAEHVALQHLPDGGEHRQEGVVGEGGLPVALDDVVKPRAVVLLGQQKAQQPAGEDGLIFRVDADRGVKAVALQPPGGGHQVVPVFGELRAARLLPRLGIQYDQRAVALQRGEGAEASLVDERFEPFGVVSLGVWREVADQAGSCQAGGAQHACASPSRASGPMSPASFRSRRSRRTSGLRDAHASRR